MITVISLRPEEAVLGHCKSLNVSGPVAPTCSQTSCSLLGRNRHRETRMLPVSTYICEPIRDLSRI
jgi:hypothetical protein